MVERGARLFASLGSSGEDFAETVNGSGHVVVDCSMVTTVGFLSRAHVSHQILHKFR
jgi:hypothetical protein